MGSAGGGVAPADVAVVCDGCASEVFTEGAVEVSVVDAPLAVVTGALVVCEATEEPV